MNIQYELLKWDSRFFGYRVAKISAKEIHIDKLKLILNECKNNNIKLIYLFSEFEDVVTNNAAKSIGSLLVDNKITYSKRIIDEFYEFDNCIKPFEILNPNEKLIRLALQSGLYSRFKLDTNFKNNEFEKLYTEWIINSVNHKIADLVLVYYENNVELGVITFKKKNNYIEIGLLGVDEVARGRSLGTKLLNATFAHMKNHGITNVKVSTQKANINACSFYKRLSFIQEKSENIYHIWF